MRLLLDAHFDPAVARTLRGRGHDIVAAVDLGPEVYQASDAARQDHSTGGQRDLAASLTQSGVADGLRKRQSQRLWRSKVRSGKTAELSAVASEVEVKRKFWPSNR